MLICCLAGSIHTAARLDAETSDHFWLTVVAVDGGMVPLSASVQVLTYYVQAVTNRLRITIVCFKKLGDRPLFTLLDPSSWAMVLREELISKVKSVPMDQLYIKMKPTTGQRC